MTVGTLTVTNRDCTTETSTAGQTFVERGPVRHMATNTGSTTTETIVTFFVPAESPMLTIPATPPRCAK